MLTVLFKILGGLGLFLFGMKIMSEGLQKVAGKKMRQILKLVSNNRFVGCSVGTLVTSIIQSSSATTVMLVGFVDSGLITFTQAVGVTLGANIGTTVTAQLIAFRIQDYALPAIAIGVLLRFFIGRRKWIFVGDVLIGFGILFYGLSTMKDGLSSMRENEVFLSVLTDFNADSYIGILKCVILGTAITILLQSSSATVGITMALASQGLLNLETSVALILGDNIGTTVTAELASIGTGINAHRTARANTLFNVIGVFIIILIFPFFLELVQFITGTLMHLGPPGMIIDAENINISRYIANSHTLFNVINAFIFLIFFQYLIKIAKWLTPGSEEQVDQETLHHIKYIDTRFIDTPSVALTNAKAEIIRMGEAVRVMYQDVIKSLIDKKQKNLSRWRKRERNLDILQREITQFLVMVTQASISPEESREVRSLLRMVNNLERIGDAVEDVAELIEKLFEQDLIFSKEGMEDYRTISSEVQKFIILLLESAKGDEQEIMEKVKGIATGINDMVEGMKERHLIRLQGGICAIDPGLVFFNMLTFFKRMGGLCFNIAQAIAGVK